jgi:hypothetical protein
LVNPKVIPNKQLIHKGFYDAGGGKEGLCERGIAGLTPGPKFIDLTSGFLCFLRVQTAQDDQRSGGNPPAPLGWYSQGKNR